MIDALLEHILKQIAESEQMLRLARTLAPPHITPEQFDAIAADTQALRALIEQARTVNASAAEKIEEFL